jgi:predicted unusual protein kinase regulating ubiquinone biosynthesis (AarF/ABC1/UbiB family)
MSPATGAAVAGCQTDRVTDERGKPPSAGRVGRTARLGRVAAGGAVRWAGDRIDSRGTDAERQRRRGDRVVATIDSLVDQLAVMRGAAMKAGQVLSTIEFPGLDEDQSEHLQRRLASLRDNVPAVGWKDMHGVLEGEWGSPPEQVLESIETEPAAAASIGQVYRGRSADGTELAIKVQYPGIAEAVVSDMRNLRLLSPILRRLMPGLEVKDVLAELAERITEECDYELEAANHRRLARFWRGHPFISVPAVDTSLSRRRVLVTEWVDGMSFEQVAGEPEPVRDRFAQIVYRFFYVTAAELGVALGDPHPGNYLLQEDGRVAFFDFGMVRELPREYLRREARVFAAIREGDAPGLVAAMRDLGYLPGPSAEWDGELLLEHMRAAGWWFAGDQPLRLAPEDIWRGTEALRDDSGGEIMGQMRRMTLPPEALLLRRMEGLLFQIASTVRAEAPWGPLLEELIEGGPPVGELGAEHAEYRASRAA